MNCLPLLKQSVLRSSSGHQSSAGPDVFMLTAAQLAFKY